MEELPPRNTADPGHGLSRVEEVQTSPAPFVLIVLLGCDVAGVLHFVMMKMLVTEGDFGVCVDCRGV